MSSADLDPNGAAADTGAGARGRLVVAGRAGPTLRALADGLRRRFPDADLVQVVHSAPGVHGRSRPVGRPGDPVATSVLALTGPALTERVDASSVLVLDTSAPDPDGDLDRLGELAVAELRQMTVAALAAARICPVVLVLPTERSTPGGSGPRRAVEAVVAGHPHEVARANVTMVRPRPSAIDDVAAVRVNSDSTDLGDFVHAVVQSVRASVTGAPSGEWDERAGPGDGDPLGNSGRGGKPQGARRDRRAGYPPRVALGSAVAVAVLLAAGGRGLRRPGGHRG